jgi:acyl transferase domain-containing protein/thioesterase domain-containing protein
VSATPVAVCGVAGRFPGAPDVDAYWELLRDGRDGLTRLGPDALARVPRRLRGHPRYVPVAGLLEGQDAFDPDPFGLTDAEAALLDPQHRHFLECAWQALERAGHGGGRGAGSVGVFAGAAESAYLAGNLAGRWDPTGGGLDPVGSLQTALSTQLDYLPLHVAYRLDLTGPAVAVATSCSTSLVAVHLAVQSLVAGECDTAVAGGASMIVPQGQGYVHVPDGVFSADGVVRPFSADGTGIVYTQGAGAVVLRRLDDARAAGDPVLAVVLGSAANNDGAGKAGFTAPSVRGQARVVAEALAVAGVAPGDVGLVEAHGTATRLGDPIEVAALRRVFGERGPAWCGLGSVKGSIGHANSAAGVASLIKAVLAVHHRTLPASLHSRPHNPHLGLDGSPFAVVEETRPWDTPPHAGVSSFGIGGTNVHVVLGPPPEPLPAPADPRPQLLVVSGATPEAAAATARAVAGTVTGAPGGAAPADVAHTLARGRAHLRYRVAGVDGALAEAPVVAASPTAPQVVLAFPGAGGHYAGMGAGLYRDEPVFAAAVDATAQRLAPLVGADPREAFAGGDPRWVRDVALAVPALYTVSLATARLLRSWGVRPDVVLGHSLGECTAAVVAGALSEDDGARLVAARCAAAGRAAGGGAMLAVPLPAAEVTRRLARHPELDLAAVNAPASCLVSGPVAAVSALADELRADGLDPTVLRLDAAMHSRRVEPALADLRRAVAGLAGSAPEVPLVSTVTGLPASAELGRGEHWLRQLRMPVLFSDALRAAVTRPSVLVEVGPGTALAGLARRHGLSELLDAVVTLSPDEPETATCRAALGRLWALGVDVDPGAPAGDRRRRVTVPGYEFRRRRLWIDPPETGTASAAHATAGTADDALLHLPVWQEEPPSAPVDRGVPFDVAGTGPLADALRLRGAPGHGPDGRSGGHRVPDPDTDTTARPLVLVEEDAGGTGPAVDRAARAVRALADAVARAPRASVVVLVTRGGAQVAGDPAPDPATAAVRVLPRVLGQERPGLRWATMDLAPAGDVAAADAGGLAADAAAVVAVVTALTDGDLDPGAELAVRGRTRWRRRHVPWVPPARSSGAAPDTGAAGSVLITGGTGAVGRTLAAHLRERGHRVVVTTRGEAGNLGDGVEVRRVDATDATATADLVRELSAQAPPALVVHAAGVVADAGLSRLDRLDPAELDAQLRVKLGGAVALREALDAVAGPGPRPAVLLMSSLTTAVGGVGIAAYAAANAAMETLAADDPDWVAAAWDGWRVGADTVVREDALDAATGTAALDLLLAALDARAAPPAVAVSTADVAARVAAAGRPRTVGAGNRTGDSTGDATGGTAEAEAAASDPVRRTLTEIWRELFALESVGPDADFFALGGHSLLGTRMLAACDDHLGVRLSLRDLLAAPTLGELAARVAAAGGGEGPAPAAGPVADPTTAPDGPARAGEPDPEVPAFDADGTFAMTRVQHAYWVGRDGGYRWGRVPCHFYLEYDCPDLDLDRFERAWNAVVARHPLLRSVTTPGGRFRELPTVPWYRIRRHDLTGRDGVAREARLATLRERMTTRPGPSDRWPLVQVQAALLPGGRTRLLLGVDVLVCDAASWWIVEAELQAAYEGRDLPAPGPHPAVCAAALHARRHGPAGRRAAEYWRSRFTAVPGPPALPVTEPAGPPRFVRRTVRLPAAEWAALLAAAARHRVTPTAALLTVYTDVLADWAGSRGFAVTLTLFDRPPVDPAVNRVVDDFTSLVLHEVPPGAPASFAARAAATQERLFADLDHREFSALELLAEDAARTGELRSVPVVFTGALGVHDMVEDTGALEWAGEQVHAVAQTPQTWLDHQVLEHRGELRLQWDVLVGALPDDALDAAVADHAARVRALARDDAAWGGGGRPAAAPDDTREGAARDDPGDAGDPGGADPDPADVVLPLRTGRGAGRPTLHLAHPSGGDVLCYAELARLLDERVDVVAVADPELAGGSGPGPESVPGIAAQYLRALARSGGRGPWLLGGWSMGGTVGQEMARQLHEAGERVALLVMLDSNDPTYIRAVPGDTADDVALGVALRHLHALEAFLGIDLDAAVVEQAPPEARPAAVADRLRAHRLLGRGEDVSGRLAVFARHLRALADHRPGRLADDRVRTLLVRADRPSPRNSGIGMGVDDTPPDRLADLGWGRHLAGELGVVGVDAHHYGLLHPPAVAVVARLLDAALAPHLP